MFPKQIEGATRTIGASQGYIGLALRDEAVDCAVNGANTPCMVSAWRPSPEEIEAQRAGAPVLLRVLGTQHPPVLVYVETPAAKPGRRWWPAEYADEIMPGGTVSPDEWIVGFCGASWIIGSPQEDERKDYTCFLVLPGAEVGFSWHEPRGHDTLTIFPDGTWKLTAGEPADWTFVFDLDDYENSDDSLDALARSNVQMHGLREGDEPVTLEVGFAKWGHAAFRLEVKDRKAKLVPVEPEATAEAAP